MKLPSIWAPQNNRGFTLIEIIICLAIMTGLFSLGLFMSMDDYNAFRFRAERDTVVSVLEQSRSRAMNNFYQSPNGVCYIAPNYILFVGATCNANDPLDEFVPASNVFNIVFPTVVFTQLSGTATPETILISNGIRSANVNINSEGRIDW